MEIKFGKMVKSIEFFKATSNLEMICFRFGQILFNLARLFAAHHEKSFVSAFFKVSYLITLGLEKEIIVLIKAGKSLEFWILKSVRTLLLTHHFSFRISNFHYPFAYLQCK